MRGRSPTVTGGSPDAESGASSGSIGGTEMGEGVPITLRLYHCCMTLLSPLAMFRVMDPLHATIEEFAADGFTHVQCYCPRCRVTRRGHSWLPRISLGLTIAQLSARLRCAECGGQVLRSAVALG